jgi:hypothetical protein
VAGLLILLLVGAPLAAYAAGHWARADGLRALRSEQASWRQVPAVVLGNAGDPLALADGMAPPQALVRWTAPDGTRRTDEVTVPAGISAGQLVRVWINASGQFTGPPLRQRQVTGDAIFAAAVAVFGLCLVVVFAGRLARLTLDRRRLAAWDADWQATGPQWTTLA